MMTVNLEGGQMALATFESLPVEIFYEIQLYALSHSLPSVSRCLRGVFCASPPSFRAQYIYGRVVSTSHSDTFTKALRYPICTLEVLDALCRQLPDHPCPNRSTCELPRRLFRSLAPKLGNRQWKEHEHPLPLLRYLYNSPRMPYPDPNAHQGYALTKAVHANFLPLIRFLLHHGASPQCKDGLAVTVAIRKKDLPLVKLLIEPDASSPIKAQEGGKTNKAKRRRLEDRIAVNSDMLKAAVRRDAKDIVSYFIHEKACVPDLQTLQMMTKGADPT